MLLSYLNHTWAFSAFSLTKKIRFSPQSIKSLINENLTGNAQTNHLQNSSIHATINFQIYSN